MIVIFIVNLAVNIAAGITGQWWSVWALLGWGLGVTIHGLVVRMARSHPFGSAWEERQIDKILASREAEPCR